ncbi:MAG: hypothetical protein NC347_10695, partial [Clostridium sp.]|nr:hypothetical protein [Clostridium sp.]
MRFITIYCVSSLLVSTIICVINHVATATTESQCNADEVRMAHTNHTATATTESQCNADEVRMAH